MKARGTMSNGKLCISSRTLTGHNICATCHAVGLATNACIIRCS